MSAATIGAQMPPEITLDDVAAMAAADEHHRYELSREAVLSIMPPASPEHALTVSRLVHWFYVNGFGPEEITTDCDRYRLRSTGYEPEFEPVSLGWLLNQPVCDLGLQSAP